MADVVPQKRQRDPGEQLNKALVRVDRSTNTIAHKVTTTASKFKPEKLFAGMDVKTTFVAAAVYHEGKNKEHITVSVNVTSKPKPKKKNKGKEEEEEQEERVEREPLIIYALKATKESESVYMVNGVELEDDDTLDTLFMILTKKPFDEWLESIKSIQSNSVIDMAKMRQRLRPIVIQQIKLAIQTYVAASHVAQCAHQGSKRYILGYEHIFSPTVTDKE